MKASAASNTGNSIVWFRSDLRLADNPALRAAIDFGGVVVPIYIHAPDEEAPWEPGAASNWWLHHSLQALRDELEAIGSRLIVRRGPTLETLLSIAKSIGARHVVWNRRYEPAAIARDTKIKESLVSEGLSARSFNSALLHEPWTIKNRSGKPFQVFTPFWRHCLSLTPPDKPLEKPRSLSAPNAWPKSLAIADLELLPKLSWADGFKAAWQPGEKTALQHLSGFLRENLEDYSEKRNRPDIIGTSRLSPHLHFGEIGPRQIWHGMAAAAREKNPRWQQSQFLAEIGWREFSHHLLFHFPQTPDEPLRPEFKKFPWRRDAAFLKAWQRGLTGYPIVDAGMRELWTTGWMHNRVRMIVASFLVKDLLSPWQEGARWFWDTLVDADLAQNTMGWQWTTGCGADAAPFFRVFNPVLQGEKFDPSGNYIRHWCPELAKLPNKWIHQPANAPAAILETAQIKPGTTYPEPIINHSTAREVALEAFAKIKGLKDSTAR